MTPKEKAESLVHKYRMLLMNDGEDYGEEILVTKLSVESALICIEEIIQELERRGYTPLFWKDVREEIKKS